jgi:LCP family protein required for cell wall assembly
MPARPRPGAAATGSQSSFSDDDVMTVDVRRGWRRPGASAGEPFRRPAGRPSGRPPAPPERPGSERGRGNPPRRGRRARRIVGVAVLLVAVWAALVVWAGVSGWNHVHRVDAMPTAGHRPTAGAGTNYVLVGSDSRVGLTKAQRKQLATGTAVGQRTDSIMLVHLPAGGGEPTLVSLPRDSYVPIPGHGSNKINASYSIGGPKLLIDTIEQVSGLHVDGYVEIGFGGFASVVDSLGGVNMCLKKPMNDKKAGINLKAGCQDLDGKNALGYVRARYSDPLGDFGRVQRQRQFLGALLAKASLPVNVVLPWRLHSIATAGGSALTVGQDESAIEVAKVMMAIRDIGKGKGNSVTVPVSDPNLQTAAGSAVKWDTPRAKQLFADLRTDTPLSITK